MPPNISKGKPLNITQSRRSHSESVLSTDSDIRFTRRKLGDSQKCGCAVIAGFLVILLLASAAVYVGHTYFKPELLPDKIFRARMTIIEGDQWSPELTDQNSTQYQHKSRDYRERINLVLRRSDLRNAYEGSEVLALDGYENKSNITVHFVLQFDPYRARVATADLHAILTEEIVSPDRRFFNNLTVDPKSLQIKELMGGIEDLTSSSNTAHYDKQDVPLEAVVTPTPPRSCEPIRINYCRSIGYNTTTYPNFFGHTSNEEVQLDLISFREMVDAECFRQAYDFICRLLQPPCEYREGLNLTPGIVCREYCQSFWSACGDRLPDRLKKYLDCERYPESTGIQSCHSQPNCVVDMEVNALSSRICDGIADCPDLSDESTCAYCPPSGLYCGRGRACVSISSRCDGKMDCPDGSDEKDCLTIAPLTTHLTYPRPIIPHRPKFFSEGFAIFSEKGTTGKLCAEGMTSDRDKSIRKTVAESLCKSLGFQRVRDVEIRNDAETNISYVRVLDPRAAEISFVRTPCPLKQAVYITCKNLECGLQSVSQENIAHTMTKMASPGDWPWHVALYRGEIHVCDGTLISEDWVLTTDSCFQGQPKATWLAIFGSVRLNAHAPWKQRRRIIGMVKSPVEGSTAALIRLENQVEFSDFIRPVCLPDEIDHDNYMISSNHQPAAGESHLKEDLNRSDSIINSSPKRSQLISENTEYFQMPKTKYARDVFAIPEFDEFSAEFVDESQNYPRAESFTQNKQLSDYPLPEHSPQTMHYEQQKTLKDSLLTSYVVPSPLSLNYALSDMNASKQHQWTQCNTLGWSKQRNHLQRVQLKLGDMSACENVSIATVNSMCAEAAFHKQDCTEEEFAGSPVICLLPDSKRWALVGIASWRITCPINGVERPRMYDKITSNSAWIRDTINAKP